MFWVLDQLGIERPRVLTTKQPEDCRNMLKDRKSCTFQEGCTWKSAASWWVFQRCGPCHNAPCCMTFSCASKVGVDTALVFSRLPGSYRVWTWNSKCIQKLQWTLMSKNKTRWNPRTRMPTRMLTNRDNTYLSHFQQTHLWDTLSSRTGVTLL